MRGNYIQCFHFVQIRSLISLKLVILEKKNMLCQNLSSRRWMVFNSLLGGRNVLRNLNSKAKRSVFKVFDDKVDG